jgi:Fe-S cluster biogenesis protein NfuA
MATGFAGQRVEEMTNMADQTGTGAKDMRSLRERVAAVLDTLRPMLQSDGGDIELIDVEADGVVKVRLQGACVGCPSASMTLGMGNERNLKDRIPEVTRVVCV